MSDEEQKKYQIIYQNAEILVAVRDKSEEEE